MADPRSINAHALLLEFLELERLSPKFEDWTEERMSENPPRLFRLRQLVALFRAFGLPWDPQSFIEGKFLDAEHPRYAALSAELWKETRDGASDPSTVRQLPHFFRILFHYRAQVGDVLAFSNGVLVSSGLYRLAHSKAGAVNRVLEESVAGIEKTLASLISPEGAAFSVKQLARDFGYPDVNLHEIDSDWA